jgi:hypothetical protein
MNIITQKGIIYTFLREGATYNQNIFKVTCKILVL